MTISNPLMAPDTAGLVIDSTTEAYVQDLDVSTGASWVLSCLNAPAKLAWGAGSHAGSCLGHPAGRSHMD